MILKKLLFWYRAAFLASFSIASGFQLYWSWPIKVKSSNKALCRSAPLRYGLRRDSWGVITYYYLVSVSWTSKNFWCQACFTSIFCSLLFWIFFHWLSCVFYESRILIRESKRTVPQFSNPKSRSKWRNNLERSRCIGSLRSRPSTFFSYMSLPT